MSRSFDEEKALRAWQRFVQIGELMPCISAPIARSWFRCKNKELPGVRILPSQLPILGARPRTENSLLIKAFQQTFEFLIDYLGEQELLLALIDQGGQLLSWQGNQQFLVSDLLKEGMAFREDNLGTMAVSLALQEKESFFVRGAEHYCSCYHQLASFASPLIIDGHYRGILGGWTSLGDSSLAVAAVSLGVKVIGTEF